MITVGKPKNSILLYIFEFGGVGLLQKSQAHYIMIVIAVHLEEFTMKNPIQSKIDCQSSDIDYIF